jgi:hypothetical protein
MVRKMSTKISHLIRLSITSAALTGFVVASGPVFPPTFGLSTPAYAVNGIRAIEDLCFWEGLGWDEMQPSEQKAWTKLGWTGEMWESETATAIPPSEYKEWGELDEVEQRALLDLGYTPESWESFDSGAC